MTPEFLSFIGFVLDHEGRTFEDDPDDPGGATKFGIDQRSHPKVDIENLTEPQAIEIYWEEWLDERIEGLPHPVDHVHFDDCVNLGVHEAVLLLQRAIGGVKDDGVLGPVTMAAANSCNPQTLAIRLLGLRHDFYEYLAQQPTRRKYLQGWLNRVSDLQNWVTGHPLPATGGAA